MKMISGKVPRYTSFIALFIGLIFNSQDLSAQGIYSDMDSNSVGKHSLHITASTILLFSAADISYNRLFQTRKKLNRYIGFSIGGGAHYLIEPDFVGTGFTDYYYGYFAKSDFVLITGSRNNFFEFNLGLVLGKSYPIGESQYKSNDKIFFPNVGLGYRKIILNEDENVVFRVGLSVLRGFYIGFGFNI